MTNEYVKSTIEMLDAELQLEQLEALYDVVDFYTGQFIIALEELLTKRRRPPTNLPKKGDNND